MPKHTWVDAAGGSPDPTSGTAFYDAMTHIEQQLHTLNPAYTPGVWEPPTAGTPLVASWMNDLEGRTGDANPREVVNARDFGFVGDGVADDTAAIQAALNTGSDVVISNSSFTVHAIARTTSTLRMPSAAPGQRFITRNAHLAPAFVGDVVQVTTMSRLDVTILGTLQPSTGDYSNVAAIRIGGTAAAYNPQQASIANSDVRSFKGSAVIWEGGSMIDFTHFHADTITVDGIRAIHQGGIDNNHGWFANTHIVNAGGRGYAILGDGSNLNDGGSRHHVFEDAKAFGCGQNFYIESRSNVGTVFSELGKTADTFTSTSRGNFLQVNETAASFEGWVDNGAGNQLSGYSVNNAWETKAAIIRIPQLGATRFTEVKSGQYTITAGSPVTVAAGSFATVNPGVAGLGSGRTVDVGWFSSMGAGVSVKHWIDATGHLLFDVYNSTSSSKSVSGVISYTIWRFA